MEMDGFEPFDSITTPPPLTPPYTTSGNELDGVSTLWDSDSQRMAVNFQMPLRDLDPEMAARSSDWSIQGGGSSCDMDADVLAEFLVRLEDNSAGPSASVTTTGPPSNPQRSSGMVQLSQLDSAQPSGDTQEEPIISTTTTRSSGSKCDNGRAVEAMVNQHASYTPPASSRSHQSKGKDIRLVEEYYKAMENTGKGVGAPASIVINTAATKDNDKENENPTLLDLATACEMVSDSASNSAKPVDMDGRSVPDAEQQAEAEAAADGLEAISPAEANPGSLPGGLEVEMGDGNEGGHPRPLSSLVLPENEHEVEEGEVISFHPQPPSLLSPSPSGSKGKRKPIRAPSPSPAAKSSSPRVSDTNTSLIPCTNEAETIPKAIPQDRGTDHSESTETPPFSIPERTIRKPLLPLPPCLSEELEGGNGGGGGEDKARNGPRRKRKRNGRSPSHQEGTEGRRGGAQNNGGPQNPPSPSPSSRPNRVRVQGEESDMSVLILARVEEIREQALRQERQQELRHVRAQHEQHLHFQQQLQLHAQRQEEHLGRLAAGAALLFQGQNQQQRAQFLDQSLFHQNQPGPSVGFAPSPVFPPFARNNVIPLPPNTGGSLATVNAVAAFLQAQNQAHIYNS